MKKVDNRINIPYSPHHNKIGYILGIADNGLILGQRLSELTGHGPTLETDMAITNIALDLFGQVRSYYQYAADQYKKKTSENDLAFKRSEREFYNTLLVEQPNRDFAYLIARQFLFDHFHFLFLKHLQHSRDEILAAIARKSIKEVTYHRDFSSDWIRNLGDGTRESHHRMQRAMDDLWAYKDELFEKTETDKLMIKAGIGCDVNNFKEAYHNNIQQVLKIATLRVPDLKYSQSGGKKGIHTEHFGHLLTEMQYMQHTYPDMEW